MTNPAQETIEGVAILYKGELHQMPRPNRHHHVIREIAKKNGIGIAGEDHQGFITSIGRFVNRATALGIALAAGQVLDVNNVRAGRLFSEDIW